LHWKPEGHFLRIRRTREEETFMDVILMRPVMAVLAMCLVGAARPDPASCITKVVKTDDGEGIITWEV